MMLKRFCEEPYRLFFPLGAVAGFLGASHWFFYATGVLTEYSSFFHSSVQSQLYLNFFVFGFLMTAGPRFAGAPHATPKEVLAFLLLFASEFIALVFHNWPAADLASILLVLALAVFLFNRMLRRGSYKPPTEFVWIPVGLFCGAMGSALSIAERAGALPATAFATGKLLKEQGFILSMVLGVGGFLGPRLMGFPGLLNPSELRSMAQVQKKRQRRIAIHLIAAVFLFFSFWLEGSGRIGAAYGLRALIVTAEIFWTTSVYRLPVTRELFARLLWLSLWMVIAGYWASWLLPLHRKAMLHIVFIGGFSMMIFAVATMVILSHAGEGDKLKKPLWALRFAAAGVILALLFRLTASFFPERYFDLLAAASVSWVGAGSCWLWFIAPKLLRHKPAASDC